MNLKDILAISGEGTLFKFIAQGKNAVIVENLETGRRFSAGASARVSALDEISIYTTGEDLPLGKIMDLIWEKESGGAALSHKQPDSDLRKYFAEVLPEYDRERVYTSDIRKVLHWYNILHKLNMLVMEEEKPAEPEAVAAEAGKDGAGKEESGSEEDLKADAGKKVSAGKKTGQPGVGEKAGAKTRKPSAPKSGKSKPAAD
jgi:hypothetical protein